MQFSGVNVQIGRYSSGTGVPPGKPKPLPGDHAMPLLLTQSFGSSSAHSHSSSGVTGCPEGMPQLLNSDQTSVPPPCVTVAR